MMSLARQVPGTKVSWLVGIVLYNTIQVTAAAPPDSLAPSPRDPTTHAHKKGKRIDGRGGPQSPVDDGVHPSAGAGAVNNGGW